MSGRGSIGDYTGVGRARLDSGDIEEMGEGLQDLLRELDELNQLNALVNSGTFGNDVAGRAFALVGTSFLCSRLSL